MNKSVKALCEAAIMIAIALVIDLLKDVLASCPTAGPC